MKLDFERRAATRESEEVLSPEILALLVTCGGRIRQSDRAAFANDAAAVAAQRLGSNPRGDDRRRLERRGGGDADDAETIRPSPPSP